MENIRSILYFKKHEEEKPEKNKDLIKLLDADLAYKLRDSKENDKEYSQNKHCDIEYITLKENSEYRGEPPTHLAVTTIKEIKIFIASQGILKEERDFIENLIRIKNDEFINSNIYLKPIRWELTDKGFGVERKQDEFNEMLLDSHIVIFLTWGAIGHYTKEEFNIGYESMKSGEKPIRIYFFNKRELRQTDDIPTQDIISYREIKDLLQKEEKYIINYQNKHELENELNFVFNFINEIK